MKSHAFHCCPSAAHAVMESLESRLCLSVTVPTPTVAITTRYSDELVITATGASDTVAVAQSGNSVSITADGRTSTAVVPKGGVFVYTRGGRDSITISPSVSAPITVDSIDNAPTTISSHGANVIAWVDSTDRVSGTANVHYVAKFAGGVSKAFGASLSNPRDAGTTTKVKLSLFGTGPIAADVNQGDEGDCYLMASLAAFADQKPGLIRNSVADLGDGTYVVEFYSKGSPEYVRVNNSFSVGTGGAFIFARPGASDSIWAMVVEKAFAYFRTGANSYNSIDAGWMSDVYSYFNVQSETFGPWIYTDAQLYSMFSHDLESGEPITLGTDSPAPNLVSDHAYTLIGVKTVHGINQYIVRNPWGQAGDKLENSQGIATLTYTQLVNNFQQGVAAGTNMSIA